ARVTRGCRLMVSAWRRPMTPRPITPKRIAGVAGCAGRVSGSGSRVSASTLPAAARASLFTPVGRVMEAKSGFRGRQRFDAGVDDAFPGPGSGSSAVLFADAFAVGCGSSLQRFSKALRRRLIVEEVVRPGEIFGNAAEIR